jgi:hypothetical protein
MISASKAITVCPFSKVACRECAIYRGRHFELCGAASHHPRKDKADRHTVESSKVFSHWDFPDLPENSNIMVDIEDFIERRGI